MLSPYESNELLSPKRSLILISHGGLGSPLPGRCCSAGIYQQNSISHVYISWAGIYQQNSIAHVYIFQQNSIALGVAACRPHGNSFVLVFHSFIPAISIAPLQVHYYSEALPTTARILYRSFTPKRLYPVSSADLLITRRVKFFTSGQRHPFE